jgi:hypothetical protein
MRYVHCPFWFGNNALIEASGMAVDAFARAIIGMYSIFLGSALLELALAAAGCPWVEVDNAEQPECAFKVHGF